MFSSPKENEPTTVTTETFIIQRLPGIQGEVHQQISIQGHIHLMAFEPVNPLLIFIFQALNIKFVETSEVYVAIVCWVVIS